HQRRQPRRRRTAKASSGASGVRGLVTGARAVRPNRITVLDTTLRDGEQSVGVALTPSEKVAIALQLERLRVDVVEAGFPATSDGEWAAVHAVAAALRGPVIAAMARATESDVDAAASALEPAHRSRVHIVLATSDVHLEHK